MAEHIAKSYSCDRCGANLGEKKPAATMNIAAIRNGEWAQEFAYKWNDFCEQCDQEVTQFFKQKVSRK